ncbi:hypothetical protein SAMN05216338_1002137 [Bradyrhizobium sp. Rc2d]|uniref:hypothetical protein n=1 Tax=Bradyrhizobium sp. Rc2d TaxID=1855321 RepID=UPI00088763DB|nr:hypothetical protein [Bradyrhizobium sp. Rc2d]SDG70282.1 hypothetical protein SAMN05216338_1002137 [Bradyrhizobium sp. Rc2d]
MIKSAGFTVAPFFLIFNAENLSAENLSRQAAKPSIPHLKQIEQITCTCAGKSYSSEAPVCTAPKKPTCVCHEAGKSPTVECK